ncbi:MAG: class I SAM-dependent methyltransferase [Actinomycetota bacterium]
MSVTHDARPAIADYDSDGYDYRTYWAGRDYEQRAEADVLGRLFDRLPPCGWLVDLGGGYGRNAEHYRSVAEHSVLVDYSTSNLERAADLHGWDVLSGRMHLVRADVNGLPFQTGAFDAALAVRLLHHLPDLNGALPEMLRTVGGWAILDIPIKHHLLARTRALLHGERTELRDRAPRVSGETSYPFHSFHLRAVREQLAELGWHSEIAASVNNFRRWDQLLPGPGVTALGPVVQSLEAMVQRVGRGWWGPNQLVRATRKQCIAAVDNPPPRFIDPRLGALAARMCCPSCRGELDWTLDEAACSCCQLSYPRHGAYWDFAL